MLYGFGKYLFLLYYKLFFRVRLTGAENIPADGSVIICSNHFSNNDPLVLGAFIKRPVHFIAKSELYRNRLFAFVLRRLKTIPTKRDAADMSSFKAVVAVLQAGGVLGIFAHGRRVREEDAGAAKSGVAFYALKAGAAVVPVRIESRYRLFGAVNIRVGKPVDLSAFRGGKLRSEELRAATEKIMAEVSAL